MGKIQNNICYESQCCRVLNEKLHIVKVKENTCGGKGRKAGNFQICISSPLISHKF